MHNLKLSEEIKRAINELGYTEATPVQKAVIPVALTGEDIVAKSQTGSGKTAAFAIPIAEQVEWEENKPQALIIVPTRELAMQVKTECTNIGRFKRVKAAAIYGQSPFAKQKLELSQKNHIVVGTPGRLLDHIEKGSLNVDKVAYLVLDEVDEMLSMGFIDQVEDILSRLPKQRQNLFFSATMPEEMQGLIKRYQDDPMVIEMASEKTNPILHVEIQTDNKEKTLKDVLITENPDSAIIFCNTKNQVDELTDLLDVKASKIHGGLRQEDRFRAMDDFKSGKSRFLIATDVAGRGIDVDNVSLVINYDLPIEKENYVHRIGRTGRAGKSGKAISFVKTNENPLLRDIEEMLDVTIEKKRKPTVIEVKANEDAFRKKQQKRPTIKKARGEKLNKNIMKLYFNGGKKKKIRAVDFVGTISKLEGITAEDIGIITIEDHVSFVEILNGKGPAVLEMMRSRKVKGRRLKVNEARKR
ncbi:ATP-dependent RNA helicase DbpA [Listeria monocytogenes]|uniref:ATP-dependent RNA helicase DbpA n=1 Tax=Listeria monocytogenes TaxID=1639 RepID=UPI000372A96A|nr:ATP-dependent RNA helicase DbpA [Listeria monocytogenes]AVV09649.1 RNA helicase [Listeria monocytogenes]EAA0102666.1 DEAD/DEAH box helicase [Listeria monocytogenes]EAA0328127.1 ATP-dependent helicase [Listeria monocytogenes]EAC2679772.1 DEAD/DEAH box helicase [Listeria monocytogenes]EAC2738115.1 DEAD/DEAH box helicase [Listeria monocytogenes]